MFGWFGEDTGVSWSPSSFDEDEKAKVYGAYNSIK